MRFDAVLRRTCARLRHGAGGELEQIQFLLGSCVGANDGALHRVQAEIQGSRQ